MPEPLELDDTFELYAEVLPEEADLRSLCDLIAPPQCVIACYPPDPGGGLPPMQCVIG